MIVMKRSLFRAAHEFCLRNRQYLRKFSAAHEMIAS